MKERKIKKLLERHQHFLKRDRMGWSEYRADFRGADLRGANLYRADLREAFLGNACLQGANLEDADLTGAYLDEADLSGACLEGARLHGASLIGAVFTGANLRWADMSGADMTGAVLKNASMTCADLRHAVLKSADMSGACLKHVKFEGANMNGVCLEDAAPMPFIPSVCPEEGAFTAFKKAVFYGEAQDNDIAVIVRLMIPEDARRVSGTGRACRADKAKVLSIINLDGSACGVDTAYSLSAKGFAYKVGRTVQVDDFCTDRFLEDAPGIHFFMTREEATMADIRAHR